MQCLKRNANSRREREMKDKRKDVLGKGNSTC